MKRIIVAVALPSWAFGLDNKIPWHYPSDMRRFKKLTFGSAVVMGRLTFESMNSRPLSNRRNIVISRSPVDVPNVETFASLSLAVEAVPESDDIWFIGGRRIYEEAMAHADEIDMTTVPDRVDDPRAVVFPRIDVAVFHAGPRVYDEEEPGIYRRLYTRELGKPNRTKPSAE